MRDIYARYMAKPQDLEDILQAGAVKARKIATPMMANIRQAVGLGAPAKAVVAVKSKKVAKPRFVSFRDEAGVFRFRLLDVDGEALLLSEPQSDPKTAGAVAGALARQGDAVELIVDGLRFRVMMEGDVVAFGPAGVDVTERDAKMDRLRIALAQMNE